MEGEIATQYQTFLGEVQHRARLATEGEARAACEATLTSLAERLTPGAADDLAAQLPPELAPYLRSRQRANPAPDFDRWIGMVAEREHQDRAQATFHARAVMAVLRDAVSAGVVQNIEAQLPHDLRSLWQAGTQGDFDA